MIREKENDKYNTPDHVFEQLNNIYNFNVDAACDSGNKKTKNGFCIDLGFCGLKESWKNKRVFCNPPFSKKDEWIKKAVREVENNECPICVMIIPLNSISSPIPFDFIIGKYEFEILRQRISFLNDKTKAPVKSNNTGTIVIYFKKKISVKNAVNAPGNI